MRLYNHEYTGKTMPILLLQNFTEEYSYNDMIDTLAAHHHDVDVLV